MAEEQRDQKEEDASMVDALSSLGWIEEKDLEEEAPPSEEEKLTEQLNLFIEQNKQLNEEISKLKEENESLKISFDAFSQEKEKALQLTNETNSTIEDLLQIVVQKDKVINELESKIQLLSEVTIKDSEISSSIESKEQEIETLKSQLGDKNQQIQELDFSSKEKNQTIQDQTIKINEINNIISDQNQKIQNFTSELEQLKSEESAHKGLVERLQEKDNKIKEMKEQLQYLENDTVQKSKFEKVAILVEKKDEIITEKEKEIFKLESLQQSYNQSIKDMQQKLETFSLVKKDVEKKEERINNLVLEIEKLTQKNMTNEEFINQIQARLEESQEKSGSSVGKLELEIMNLRNVIDEQIAEIKDLRENGKKLKDKLYETEQIEDRILTEMQKVKDEKLKLESKYEAKDSEIIELKKKIKVMRRDIKKS